MKFANLPNSQAFKKNELSTLQFINARYRLLKHYPKLYQAIQSAYLTYKSKQNFEFDFNFSVNFEMEVEDDIHNIFIGGFIQGDFEMCTYYLALAGKGDDKDKIIRKYHFDFAKPTIKTEQRVPTFHLQYGGSLSEGFGEYDGQYLSKWLSVPRLNFAPVNLALLLDILFCEFDCKETNDLVQDREWRKLIYDNEVFISTKYYESIQSHIQSEDYAISNLIRDYCYNEKIA
jgi:hypothetical protein